MKTKLASNSSTHKVSPLSEDSSGAPSRDSDDTRGNFYPKNCQRHSMVPVGPPNSKGSRGRQLLVLTVNAAIERATQAGNMEIAYSVRRMYEESLSDPLLAELMDAVLAQRATEEQMHQFRAILKKIREANPHVRGVSPSLAGARDLDEKDTYSIDSDDSFESHESPDAIMDETRIQRQSMTQNWSLEQEQATSSKNKITNMVPSGIDDGHQNNDISNAIAEGIQLPGSSKALGSECNSIPTLAATNPLAGNINALKTKLQCTPNNKTIHGRHILSIVVDGCVKRSCEEGIPAVGQAIKSFYNESLSNPSMADLFDELFAGKASKKQIHHFQNYVQGFVQGT